MFDFRRSFSLRHSRRLFCSITLALKEATSPQLHGTTAPSSRFIHAIHSSAAFFSIDEKKKNLKVEKERKKKRAKNPKESQKSVLRT